MPITKSRLTRTEAQEYRTRLLELEKMGIPIWRGGDFWHEPNSISLEQIEPAVIYELPLDDIAFVGPVEMTVLTSRILIKAAEMTTPWDDLLLDLSDPEEIPYYEDLIAKLPEPPPKILNHWLTHKRPLGLRREEGLIIAYGRSRVPPECHDGKQVPVRLILGNPWGNELCFDFEARVDRSIKRKYAPRLRECLTTRVPIFRHEETETRDQDGTIHQQVRGPVSPAPVVVSLKKPIEGSSLDVPRDETGEPIGV